MLFIVVDTGFLECESHGIAKGSFPSPSLDAVLFGQCLYDRCFESAMLSQ